MKKQRYKPIVITEDMHEKVRTEAFNKRISMKEVVERALRKTYGWGKGKKTKEVSNESPNNGPPSE